MARAVALSGVAFVAAAGCRGPAAGSASSGCHASAAFPAGAVALLMDILEAMAAGRGVTIIPENAELTTVEAADVLNVSRPFIIKLLDEGAIPHRKVGKHRRIRVDDVMNYKAKIDAERPLSCAYQRYSDAARRHGAFRAKSSLHCY